MTKATALKLLAGLGLKPSANVSVIQGYNSMEAPSLGKYKLLSSLDPLQEIATLVPAQ